MRLLILLTILVGAAPSAPPELRVVVNQANPVSSLSRQEVSDLFLKKSSRWEVLGLVMPVDQPEATAVRDVLNREIHHKSLSAVRAYWQQRIFSGRDVPPPEKDGDAEVLAFVRKNPGAIGYISSTASAAGVKVVEVRM
jgi:ABC-type phosphate transport system substrate-binding protein